MQPPWNADLVAAIALRDGGHATEALPTFVSLSERHPDSAEVQYHTAWCHDCLGREGEAVPFYERALALGLTGDDRAGAFLGLGSTHRTLGHYDQALAILEQGVQAFPDDRGLQVFLAMARYNAGQSKAAVSALLLMLADTTGDEGIRRYDRAIRLYAEDLDRTWP
jgi:tetratricopeptide (TPR) repeat protein